MTYSSEPTAGDAFQPWKYSLEPSQADRLGIAFSGGGIRSASFCLGAYQFLNHKKIFHRASYVTGVSGGGYIATALAVAMAKSEDAALRQGGPVWAHGSPEEEYLRNHLSYLAPGMRGRIWLAANYAQGLLLNIVPLFLISYLSGKAYGLFLRRYLPGLGESSGFEPARLVPAAFWVLIFLSLSLLTVGVRRFLESGAYIRCNLKSDAFERIVEFFASIAVIIALLGILLTGGVQIVSWILSLFYSTPGQAPSFEPFSRSIVALLVVTFFLLVGLVALVVSRFKYTSAIGGVLAWVSAFGFLLAPMLVAAQGSLIRGWDGYSDGIITIICLVLLSIFWLAIPTRKFSMHLYYRERLSKAFILRRTCEIDGVHVRALPYELPVKFSNVGSGLKEKRERGFSSPHFVLCAAIAAREGDVPSGAWASSFTFEADYCSGPRLGIKIPSSRLENTFTEGGADLTLPSIMAISGAAISPLMGRFSRPAFRLLLAIFNLRLGVWLPNGRALPPSLASTVDSQIDSHFDHAEDIATPPLTTDATNVSSRGRPEEALTAPIDDYSSNNKSIDNDRSVCTPGQHRRGHARIDLKSTAKVATRHVSSLIKQPGAGSLLREGLGLVKKKSDFVHVSDGGHWENLGLIELIRRRCTHIIVVDASVSARNPLGDLARAVGIARAELGVDIELDPRCTVPGMDDHIARSPVAFGQIRYPEGLVGEIYYTRSVLWADAPFDLHVFRDLDPQFPRHPTANQLFSGEQFDAYRALGWEVAKCAVEQSNAAWDLFEPEVESREKGWNGPTVVV